MTESPPVRGVLRSVRREHDGYVTTSTMVLPRACYRRGFNPVRRADLSVSDTHSAAGTLTCGDAGARELIRECIMGFVAPLKDAPASCTCHALRDRMWPCGARAATEACVRHQFAQMHEQHFSPSPRPNAPPNERRAIGSGRGERVRSTGRRARGTARAVWPRARCQGGRAHGVLGAAVISFRIPLPGCGASIQHASQPPDLTM